MEAFGVLGAIGTILALFLLGLAILMPYFVLQIRNSSEKTAKELAKVNQNLAALISAVNSKRTEAATPPLEDTNNLAICPACDEKILFSDTQKGQQATCSSCKTLLILPESVSRVLRTSKAKYADKPAIIPLPPADDRPGVSRAKCGSCDKLLTYPEKQAGKEVKCPGCQAAFALP